MSTHLLMRTMGGYCTDSYQNQSVRMREKAGAAAREIALAGSRRLRSALAAAPVLYAHAGVTVIELGRIITPNAYHEYQQRGWQPRNRQCHGYSQLRVSSSGNSHAVVNALYRMAFNLHAQWYRYRSVSIARGTVSKDSAHAAHDQR